MFICKGHERHGWLPLVHWVTWRCDGARAGWHPEEPEGVCKHPHGGGRHRGGGDRWGPPARAHAASLRCAVRRVEASVRATGQLLQTWHGSAAHRPHMLLARRLSRRASVPAPHRTLRPLPCRVPTLACAALRRRGAPAARRQGREREHAGGGGRHAGDWPGRAEVAAAAGPGVPGPRGRRAPAHQPRHPVPAPGARARRHQWLNRQVGVQGGRPDARGSRRVRTRTRPLQRERRRRGSEHTRHASVRDVFPAGALQPTCQVWPLGGLNGLRASNDVNLAVLSLSHTLSWIALVAIYWFGVACAGRVQPAAKPGHRGAVPVICGAVQRHDAGNLPGVADAVCARAAQPH